MRNIRILDGNTISLKINDQKMDIYDMLSLKIFFRCQRQRISNTQRGLRAPLNALVLLPFILFRNIQRHRTRGASPRATGIAGNQDSLIPIRIRAWPRARRGRHKF